MKILDVNGQLLYQDTKKSYNTGQHKWTIPTAFPAGTYFLKINSDVGYFRTMKFTKV